MASGAIRIFLYNWPIYLATWTVALLLLIASPFLGAVAGFIVLLAGATALLWSIASLLVSFYLYGPSRLASGRWIPALVGGADHKWASIHAGLDAEIDLDSVMAGPCVARLDIFDHQLMSSPSIMRARARTAMMYQATACSSSALALGDATCDLLIVAFSAHEIRDGVAREAFFAELRRALRPGGKVLLVEHLRDWANFAAFGPGFLHFLPRNEWLRLASKAALRVVSEARITPWIMALILERNR